MHNSQCWFEDGSAVSRGSLEISKSGIALTGSDDPDDLLEWGYISCVRLSRTPDPQSRSAIRIDVADDQCVDLLVPSEAIHDVHTALYRLRAPVEWMTEIELSEVNRALAASGDAVAAAITAPETAAVSPLSSKQTQEMQMFRQLLDEQLRVTKGIGRMILSFWLVTLLGIGVAFMTAMSS